MRNTDFMSSLKAFAAIQPLDPALSVDKDALFAAEVSLPLAPGFCADGLRLAFAREAYSSAPRPLLVDVSRLTAP